MIKKHKLEENNFELVSSIDSLQMEISKLQQKLDRLGNQLDDVKKSLSEKKVRKRKQRFAEQ